MNLELTKYTGRLTSIIIITVLVVYIIDYSIEVVSIPYIKSILILSIGMKLGTIWCGVAKRIEEKKLSLVKFSASNKYKKGSGYGELSNGLRALVYRYKKTNDDFMFNISLNNEIIIQILHRAHFPDILNSEEDNRFGMVFYSTLGDEKKLSHLESLLKAESIKCYINDIDKSLFFELGDSNFTGFANYIVAKILLEVFGAGKNVEFKLGYVGKLPN